MPGDPPILCPCGNPIGRLYPLFYKARAIRHREHAGIDPAQLAISHGLTLDIGDIGDALGMTLTCCRATISTWRELRHERMDYIDSMDRLPEDK